MDGDFLHSKEWEEFQTATGAETFRINGALIIKKPLPFNQCWWYTPRLNQKSKINHAKSRSSIWLENQKLKIKGDEPVFWKIEGEIENGRWPMRKSASIQPEKTVVLELKKSEDDLLAAMHPKTRYNIRLALKKTIRVSAADQKSFEEFWKLLEETGKRDKFSLHPKKYYQKMLEMLPAKLWRAEFKNKILSSAIVLYFNNTVYYLHGASSTEQRNLMAPYLLHWEIIKAVKAAGFKYYDLWGIDEKKWPGLTRFKRGFGGAEKSYPPTFDLIFKPLYYKVYLLLKWLQKLF